MARPDSVLVNDQADSGRIRASARRLRQSYQSGPSLPTAVLPLHARLATPSSRRPDQLTRLVDPTDLLRQFLVAPHPVGGGGGPGLRAVSGAARARRSCLAAPASGLACCSASWSIHLPKSGCAMNSPLPCSTSSPKTSGRVPPCATQVALVGLISAIVAAYVDEFAKLIMLLVVGFVMARPSNPRAVAAAAIAPTAGYALSRRANSPSPRRFKSDLPGAESGIRLRARVVLGRLAVRYRLHAGPRRWLSGRLAGYVLLAGVSAHRRGLHPPPWMIWAGTRPSSPWFLPSSACSPSAWGASLIPAGRRWTRRSRTGPKPFAPKQHRCQRAQRHRRPTNLRFLV